MTKPADEERARLDGIIEVAHGKDRPCAAHVAFHNLAVSERNRAWETIKRLRRDLAAAEKLLREAMFLVRHGHPTPHGEVEPGCTACALEARVNELLPKESV